MGKALKILLAMASALFIAMPSMCQWHQPGCGYVEPQQVFAMYQAWLQNANLQFGQQTSGLPPAMQLQLSINVIEGELSQWGGFLQQYYPMMYASRCNELQQRRQLLVQMTSGAGAWSVNTQQFGPAEAALMREFQQTMAECWIDQQKYEKRRQQIQWEALQQKIKNRVQSNYQ